VLRGFEARRGRSREGPLSDTLIDVDVTCRAEPARVWLRPGRAEIKLAQRLPMEDFGSPAIQVKPGDVAQLVRALPCHGRGRGFEPRRPRHSKRNI
jgi:hypothetical protein